MVQWNVWKSCVQMQSVLPNDFWIACMFTFWSYLLFLVTLCLNLNIFNVFMSLTGTCCGQSSLPVVRSELNGDATTMPFGNIPGMPFPIPTWTHLYHSRYLKCMPTILCGVSVHGSEQIASFVIAIKPNIGCFLLSKMVLSLRYFNDPLHGNMPCGTFLPYKNSKIHGSVYPSFCSLLSHFY